MSKRIIENWQKMVDDAKDSLISQCPLVEDEAIVFINEKLKKLELENEEFKKKIIRENYENL